MKPADVYSRILDELIDQGGLDDLERLMLIVLRRAYPAAVTREQMVERIFGYIPDNLTSSTEDRKCRIAKASLQEQGVPIVSSSGEKGYRLTTDKAAIEAMIAEWESRRERLGEQIRAAHKTLSKIERAGVSAIPTEVPARQRASQMNLFGG